MSDQIFDAIDTDHGGTITSDELKCALLRAVCARGVGSLTL